ncbi:hypothetical protein [Clostridium sp. CCUG 7971]|uniref:hypothetical protein n=1 Tax=Clostridium sp. CCUG 7971 TaxID=2811414 RepID=UPI001ABB49FB|nr:hypothetical protein [Clostridium sp. CCUG 7971]MBO3445110.1 hypothetical protein [Clostridium sp. CCUG 7971]
MNYIKASSKYEVFVKNIGIKQRFEKLITKSVNITQEQLKECREFALDESKHFDKYKNLIPKEIKNKELQQEVLEQRIFVEKVSECGFLNYLMSKGIDESVINKKKIAIKTAIAKEIHTRLIIDKDEFENNKSNYYVGVHLNLEMEDKKDKVKRHLIKDLYNIEKVQIFGYLDYKFINELKYETIKNREGKKEHKFFTKKAHDYKSKKEYAKFLDTDCKWYYLDRLMPIDNIIKNLK